MHGVSVEGSDIASRPSDAAFDGCVMVAKGRTDCAAKSVRLSVTGTRLRHRKQRHHGFPALAMSAHRMTVGGGVDRHSSIFTLIVMA